MCLTLTLARLVTCAAKLRWPNLSQYWTLALPCLQRYSQNASFDGLGRGDGQGQLSLVCNSRNFIGCSFKLLPDKNYLAWKLDDDLQVHGSSPSHWWAPGWILGLVLTNDARPMPQIGLQRVGGASSWPRGSRTISCGHEAGSWRPSKPPCIWLSDWLA